MSIFRLVPHASLWRRRHTQSLQLLGCTVAPLFGATSALAMVSIQQHFTTVVAQMRPIVANHSCCEICTKKWSLQCRREAGTPIALALALRPSLDTSLPTYKKLIHLSPFAVSSVSSLQEIFLRPHWMQGGDLDVRSFPKKGQCLAMSCSRPSLATYLVRATTMQ